MWSLPLPKAVKDARHLQKVGVAKKGDEGGPGVMKTDSALIQAIRADKCRAAFRELFCRHQRAAYALALRITGRSEWAEEALQEAMLAVWRLCDSYRESGYARGWLMRIVAQMSLRVRRRELRHSGSVRRNSAPQDDLRERGPEGEEALRALRMAMAGLTGTEQRLLALRFERDLTQAQIGNVLALPVRTVSYRLGQCLNRLRGQLRGLELASA